MKENTTKGSLEEYRGKGKNNQDISDLVDMIDRLQIQLTKALEAYAKK